MAAWANTALVGRLPELERLEEHLRESAAGRGGTVLLAGDAGIGKTRLVTEVGARAHAAGAQPLVGRCIDLVGAEVPYLPVAEALRPLTGREDVRELLASARELRWLLPGTVLGGEPTRRRGGAPGSQLGLLEELLALLDVAAADEPVVLVLEDLHWADTSTLDLVALLAYNLGERRVLLLGTYRADELPAEHRLRRLVTGLLRAGVATRLELGPLGREELEALLHSRTPPRFTPAVTEAIVARSEGNPFFAEELLAAAGQGGDDLPHVLRDLLLQRVARLDLAPPGQPAGQPSGLGELLGLTPREAEVLGLVARGSTNRQIAAALVISVKTASVHVSHILDKLDARNRVEAAAIARRLT